MEDELGIAELNPLAIDRLVARARRSQRRKNNIIYDIRRNPLPNYAVKFRGRLTGRFDDEELRVGPKYYKTGRGKKGNGSVVNHVVHRKLHPRDYYMGF